MVTWLKDDETGEKWENPTYTHVEEEMAVAELFNTVRRILIDTGNFTERECYVICERFGLWDRGSGKALHEIAEEMNCTRERVRQIEFKVLRKLRHPRHAKRLVEYL